MTEEEYQRCQSNPQLGKTWFNMTSDVFIAFFLDENQIAPVICILVNCLLIPLDTYHVLILMFLRVIHF
jgi:hypothetical protein